jgi:hypothetical protein
MSSIAKRVEDIIASLQENFNPNDLIAVNWWSAEDFEDYADTERALDLAQQFLDRINPELGDYVFAQMRVEEEENENKD